MPTLPKDTAEGPKVEPLLRKHIETFGRPNALVIGVATSEYALVLLKAQLKSISPSIRFYPVFLDKDQRDAMDGEVQKALGHVDPGNTIVLIADLPGTNVTLSHTKCTPFKEAGLIVATCFTRHLFWGPPDNTAGITYQSIFYRIGQLIGGPCYQGDYLEFGVFDGRTMSLAWQTMKQVRGLRFFGFDTYAGITGSKKSEEKVFQDGTFFSNLETFGHNMNLVGADPSRVTPIKGDFLEVFKNPKTLQNEHNISRCAVAHIDCDVYKPAKAALDFITDIIIQGAFLLFDEFHAHGARNDMGERRALAEWLDENPHIQVERWHDYAGGSRAYIVHVDESVR